MYRYLFIHIVWGWFGFCRQLPRGGRQSIYMLLRDQRPGAEKGSTPYVIVIASTCRWLKEIPAAGPKPSELSAVEGRGRWVYFEAVSMTTSQKGPGFEHKSL
jgi:hypothetical protein